LHEGRMEELERSSAKERAAHDERLESLEGRLHDQTRAAQEEHLEALDKKLKASIHVNDILKGQSEKHEKQASEHKLQLQATRQRGERVEALQGKVRRSLHTNATLSAQLENYERRSTDFRRQLEDAREHHAQLNSVHENRIDNIEKTCITTEHAHEARVDALEQRLHQIRCESKASEHAADALEDKMRRVSSEHRASLTKGVASVASHPQMHKVLSILQSASAGLNAEVESAREHQARVSAARQKEIHSLRSEVNEAGITRSLSLAAHVATEVDMRRTRSS